MCPKNLDPPTAMTDKKGNLLTSDKAIKQSIGGLFGKT